MKPNGCEYAAKTKKSMNKHLSDKTRSNYLHILGLLNNKRANIFTIQELADYFTTSKRTMSDFVNGKIFDFCLLDQYAAILGEDLMFWLSGES